MTSDTSAKQPRSDKRWPHLRYAGPSEVHARQFRRLLHELIQPLDRSRREVYFGDLDLASITEAIGLAVSERDWRDPGWREKYRGFDTRLGVEGQRPINALSISHATSIPRETTRRKIRKLIKLGILTEVRRSECVITPGFLQRADIQERFERGIALVVRFINGGLESGVFLVSEPLRSRSGIVRAGMLAEHSRIFSYLVHILIQRLDHARRDVYFNDLDLASIGATIEMTADAGTQQGSAAADGRAVPGGAAHPFSVNALSIARATGIPRETTRRKIKELTELGMISEIGRGRYMPTLAFLQSPDTEKYVERAAVLATRFINDCLDHGIFRWAGDE